MSFFKIILTLIFVSPFGSAIVSQTGGDLNREILEDYYQRKYGQKGCFETMLEGVDQSIATSLKTQTNETNSLLGLSQNYYEQEQRCGNELAAAMSELTSAKADHEEKLLKLPAQIELQKIEHEEAVLAVHQECEQSSGAVFQEWKAMTSQGVITPERGGPMALFSRGRNINRYQKLFYDDCLASKNNIKRVDIMARKLKANLQLLQAGADASAMKLASLSKDLSFKQGVITQNCMNARKQLDYQSKLVRANVNATNSAARTQNFLRMLNGANVCLGGPGNNIFTPQGQKPATTGV